MSPRTREQEIRDALQETPLRDRDSAEQALTEVLELLDAERAAHGETALQLVMQGTHQQWSDRAYAAETRLARAVELLREASSRLHNLSKPFGSELADRIRAFLEQEQTR